MVKGEGMIIMTRNVMEKVVAVVGEAVVVVRSTWVAAAVEEVVVAAATLVVVEGEAEVVTCRWLELLQELPKW